MTGNGTGPRESPPPMARGTVLGGPTIRVTVEMQVRDRAAHWSETIRLAPGSVDSHGAVVADEARKAVRELATYLAIDRVEGKRG